MVSLDDEESLLFSQSKRDSSLRLPQAGSE
jgi:hypothetical protein